MVRQWLGELGVKTLFIEPGSPWENGYNESFNGTLRNELLKREIFYSLEEAKVLIEQWRREYNTHRPHSSLGYRTPGPRSDPARPKAAQPTSASWTTPQPKGGAWTNTLGGTAFGGRSRWGVTICGDIKWLGFPLWQLLCAFLHSRIAAVKSGTVQAESAASTTIRPAA